MYIPALVLDLCLEEGEPDTVPPFGREKVVVNLGLVGTSSFGGVAITSVILEAAKPITIRAWTSSSWM